MNWNPITEAQRFLQRASAHKPERGSSDYEDELAMQDLLDECYVLSFSREQLVGYLARASKGEFEVPKDIDEKRYRDAYRKGAARLLNELEGRLRN